MTGSSTSYDTDNTRGSTTTSSTSADGTDTDATPDLFSTSTSRTIADSTDTTTDFLSTSTSSTITDSTDNTMGLLRLLRSTGSNEADQSHTLGVEIEMIDEENQLQPGNEQKYVEDQTLVEVRSLEDKGQQEQLAPKVERHRRKKNLRKDNERATWLYKDNSNVRLYTQKHNINKNLRHMKRSQFELQRLYLELLNRKYNELQKLKSLLLPKLGLNFINYS